MCIQFTQSLLEKKSEPEDIRSLIHNETFNLLNISVSLESP